MTREDVPKLVSETLDGRRVEWLEAWGDYDGRERSLGIYDTDSHDQLPSLRRLRHIKDDMDAAAGGPIVIIFFTKKQSQPK